MSHLGDLLSAHVDSELDGAERDRVSAHLARCEQCRTEAATLRELKRQLGGLVGEAPAEADVTQRLLAAAELTAATGLASPAGKAGKLRGHRVLTRPSHGSARVAGSGGVTGAGGHGPSGPGGPSGSRRPRLTRRRRYLMLGTVSIVMGLGTAAFTVGGGDPAPGPRIVPQVELFSEEHAITTGGVPFDGPGPAMDPAMSTAASPASSAARQP
jgi:anti-sigma factor RsiW